MKWNEIAPVMISVTVIILVAVLQRQSKLIAGVTATMPVTIPLALWIVYSSNHGDQAAVAQFTQSLVTGIIPTAAFVATIWLASRAGMKLLPMIGLGYTVWGTILATVIWIRRMWGGLSR
jgi:hypothetical protein